MSPNQMCIEVAEGDMISYHIISFTTVFYTMRLFSDVKNNILCIFSENGQFSLALKSHKDNGHWGYQKPTKSHWWQYCQNHQKMWTLVSHKLEYNQLLPFRQSPTSLSIFSPLVFLSHHRSFPLNFLLLYLLYPLWPKQRADQTDHYCRSVPKRSHLWRLNSLKDYFWKKNLIDGDVVNKLRVTTELFDQTCVSRRQTPYTNCAVPENRRRWCQSLFQWPNIARIVKLP